MNIDSIILTSLIDYPGNVACTIFTSGCNYDCWYCHNKKLISNVKNNINEAELFDKLAERREFLDGVVICGGEPTLQPDLVLFIAKVKALGLKVKLDTNGSNPHIIRDLLDKNMLDYIAVDIKAPFSKYAVIIGESVATEKVKESIDIVMSSGIAYEFRTTFSPDLLIDDIEEIAKGVAGAKVYFVQQFVVPEHLLGSGIKPHSPDIFDIAVERAAKHVPAYRRG